MAEKYDIKRPRLQKKAEPDKKILFSRNIDSKQSKTNEATLKVTFIVKNSNYVIILKLIFFFFYFSISKPPTLMEKLCGDDAPSFIFFAKCGMSS